MKRKNSKSGRLRREREREIDLVPHVSGRFLNDLGVRILIESESDGTFVLFFPSFSS